MLNKIKYLVLCLSFLPVSSFATMIFPLQDIKSESFDQASVIVTGTFLQNYAIVKNEMNGTQKEDQDKFITSVFFNDIPSEEASNLFQKDVFMMMEIMVDRVIRSPKESPIKSGAHLFVVINFRDGFPVECLPEMKKTVWFFLKDFGTLSDLSLYFQIVDAPQFDPKETFCAPAASVYSFLNPTKDKFLGKALEVIAQTLQDVEKAKDNAEKVKLWENVLADYTSNAYLKESATTAISDMKR